VPQHKTDVRSHGGLTLQTPNGLLKSWTAFPWRRIHSRTADRCSRRCRMESRTADWRSRRRRMHSRTADWRSRRCRMDSRKADWRSADAEWARERLAGVPADVKWTPGELQGARDTAEGTPETSNPFPARRNAVRRDPVAVPERKKGGEHSLAAPFVFSFVSLLL
jgi:hypothetical protein